jgi:hypothetical protein
MQKEYQLYLFSQLFHETLKDCIEDTPYDLLFSIIVNELEKFEESDYNDENQSEYDCMMDYLSVNADIISITISDHSNI